MEPDAKKSVRQQAGEMVGDIAGEVKHEAHNIRYVKEPVDPTHSDVVVRRHVTGISISFFILIAIFLLAVIAGVAIYEHGHRAGPPRMIGTLAGSASGMHSA
jgi:hypothetical protein